MAQLLAGQKVVLSDGSKVEAEVFLKDKVVAVYFSAGWCPPCRAFTPKLKKFYEELKKAGKNFEVLFVSRDRAATDLVEYVHKLQFLSSSETRKFSKTKVIGLYFQLLALRELLEKYEVKTIPTCKVIKPDGTIVVNDARTEVQEKGVENALGLWEEWLGFYEA